MEGLDAASHFPSDEGYRFTGSPQPINTALDYVEAQLMTQGHFQGEGECLWEVK